jgi:hypothetical protein
MLRVISKAALLLAVLASARLGAAAQVNTITVSGRLTSGGASGSYVNATATRGRSGFTGQGTLYGRNPQTGRNYSYPFVINSATTGPNTVILYGNFTSGPAVRLSATVPNGALTFVYRLANGTQVSSSGSGTVSLR